MKNRLFTIILIIVAALVMVAAYFGYDYISEKYLIDSISDSIPDALDSDPAKTGQVQSGLEVDDTSPDNKESSGNVTADFTVYDGDGNAVKLSDIIGKDGKPTIVNFWATWCGPCMNEMPHFDKLYREKGDKLSIMMVNLTDGSRDTVESVKKFAEDSGFEFPVYFDTQMEAAYAYSVYSIPLTLFISESGEILYQYTGSLSEKALDIYVDALLK